MKRRKEQESPWGHWKRKELQAATEGQREREKKQKGLIERGKTGRPRSTTPDSRGKRTQLATKKTTDQQGEGEGESRLPENCPSRAFRTATEKPPEEAGEEKKFDRKEGEGEAGSKDGIQQAFQQDKLYQKIGR